MMAALPFFLLLWFSPLALFATRLRSRKRRMTLGDIMIMAAAAAAVCTLILSGPGPLRVAALLAVYVAPKLGAVIYIRRAWDIALAIVWSVAVLLLLLA